MEGAQPACPQETPAVHSQEAPCLGQLLPRLSVQQRLSEARECLGLLTTLVHPHAALAACCHLYSSYSRSWAFWAFASSLLEESLQMNQKDLGETLSAAV